MNHIAQDKEIAEILAQLGLDAQAFRFDLHEDPAQNGLAVRRSRSDVSITYSQRSYLFRALGLFKEHLCEPDYTVCEEARFTMNGIMLDCSRNGVPRLSTVKQMIRQLALMGHNMLMLYTEDTYEVENNPYFGYFRGRYTLQELRELDDYAAGYGIEIIPCIQTLGHLEKALKWSNTYGDVSDTQAILLVGEEKTYRLIDEMLHACRRAFRSKRIHLGLDETHGLGHGKFYERNGDVDKMKILEDHVARVQEICARYDFRPMIAGDMPLRMMGCKGYTDGDFSVEELDVSVNIPQGVDFIYWDYYSTTSERYGEMIRAHQRISDSVIFSGGAWRWGNFTPCTAHSLQVSRLALEQCVKHGIREVYTTLWGDDGNESSFFASWPVVQLFAETGFHSQLDDATLARRFATCVDENWDDFCKLELPNQPRNVGGTAYEVKPYFYQDPMQGLFDAYVGDGFNRYYAECAATLWDCAGRSKGYGYVFSTLAAFCDVLADKCELGLQIKRAYDAGDRAALREIASQVLPRVQTNLVRFRDLLEAQWNRENKVFGFEVLDIRLGGLLQRLKTAQSRIERYLSGELDALPELEEARLPYDGRSDIAGCPSYLWTRIASTSPF